MAETTNAAAAPKKKSGPNPVLEGVSSFLKIISWLAAGLVFLFLGVICKIKRPIPAAWEPFFAHHIPHLPYFVCGFGFICLAYARGLLRKTYVTEQKKDFFSPHAWKISLMSTQLFLLWVTGLYAIAFGLNMVPPVGMLGLVFFISCFLLYLLTYQIEYFKNRLPAFAALRIGMMSFVFAGLAFVLWTVYQMIVPSLIVSALAVFAGIYSLSYTGTVRQKGIWLNYLFMIGAVVLLGFVGYYVLDFWKPQTEPLDTVVVTKGLRGDINNLIYAPNGKQVAYTQKLDHKWSLMLISPDEKAPVTIKLPELEGPLQTLFTDDSKALLADPMKGDNRELVNIDTETGAITTLIKSGVEPFSGGTPWLKATHQFLFVTKDAKGYTLRRWTQDDETTDVLYSSSLPILSPSWVNEGEVVYVDGTHATPYLLDLETKKAEEMITEAETKDTDELVETDPLVEVIPSPDHFRYLCVGQKDGKTTLWSMLDDSTKRVELYKTDNQLTDIAWLADGQKIVFERTGLQRGFKTNSNGIVLLNANLRTTENLVPAQINIHSPATSPDGIKIAFVGSEGLWYPSLDSGIWVVVLR